MARRWPGYSGADPHRAQLLGGAHRGAADRRRRLPEQTFSPARVAVAHPGFAAPCPWPGQSAATAGRRLAAGREPPVRQPRCRGDRADRRRVSSVALFHAAPAAAVVQKPPGRAYVRRRDRARFQRIGSAGQSPARQARPRGDRNQAWPGLSLYRCRRMKSIQRRLSLGLFGVLLVVGLLLAQTSLWLFELGLRRYLEVGLRNEAEGLLVSINRGAAGPQLDPQRLTPSYSRPLSGHYYRVEAMGQVWRSRSLWDHELAKPAEPGLQKALVEGPQGQQLLVLRGDYRRFVQPLSITVAEDYSPLLSSFRRVKYIGLGLGLAGLLLVLFLQRLTVRNALRPLEQARQQIAQLQDGQRAQLETQE